MNRSAQKPAGRPAIFLDRDGTIIEEVEYLSRLGDLKLIAGVGPAIARLNRLALPVILVSNQSGIARGYFDEEFVRQCHRRLQEMLKPYRARIDDFFFCPHHPDHGRPEDRQCDCRKPAPGMLLEAANRHNLDLRQCFVVGDKASDLELAKRVGGRGILVLTGYGRQTATRTATDNLEPAAIARDLAAAVDWIIGELDREREEPGRETARGRK